MSDGGSAPLRILHCPDTVGGNPGGLARAERAVGLDSRCVSVEPSPFSYSVDEVLRRPGTGRVVLEARRLRLLWVAARWADVVHYNFGRTILPPPAPPGAARRAALYGAVAGMRELPLLRRAGKAIVVTFQGDDVRQGDILRERHAESVATANPDNYPAAVDPLKRRIAATFDRYADAIFYLNPDLASVLPARARFLPYASVDPREWAVTRGQNPRPLVVHAPSDRLTKGTKHVLAAVDGLRAEGIDFDFELVESISHRQARRIYERADVFVDQLQVGWYGAAAVELMALGKPVLCFIRESDLRVLPDEMRSGLPLVNVSPFTLRDALRRLVLDAGERERVGRASRAFVERWHDPEAIAAVLANVYLDAVSTRRPSRLGRG